MSKIKELQIDDTSIPINKTDPKYESAKLSPEERHKYEMEFKLITLDDEVFIKDLLKKMDSQDEVTLNKSEMNKLSNIIRKSNILVD